ncbi:hypothetical protein A3A76_05650 [Candidatus Woesebacteria bacterium RIFCSPLOWO2_01_FULL_39_23]|uniref:Uncharacterized protein n=1 Tax=Candidatus Woesebacteria bacterium RIFCSPHIGHO2_01_FULL_40_22 TaxID=1802499 RepID=A0A1F7YM20_9BACT|nr:MAG: hypothetical protein A2141_03660 [Candidatus Woesebacteria bacterium RBG_16_40_11]OGM27939.1 MAG: hypothetical protein A2628_03575 [Candidatus Woesebacteria bacterium RIFCSPHIGHO2_01_FULL_40_22]OGM37543.1 MAG: hypothetical protein A3E41_01800 [Candidatus Woesebacteria bacterium RIFCSPHIGHO2_12_FULL_38_9]OGM61695.1 MAG: hypothetical protein A3A76_05650 [Candidatus Woesebacteria bacterium RIFCSPLOWO2_01_FULL_39_23]
MKTPERLTNKQQIIAASLGGEDLGSEIDERYPNKPYYDKGNHRASSIFHSPNHKNHPDNRLHS